MNAGIAALVLLSAVLHASWNAIAKGIRDRLASATLIGLAYLVIGAAGALWLPAPAAASWPFLACSACLQTAYLILLTAAYRHGDFGQVYPLARGLAVLLVAAVATVFLGQYLTALQLAGVAVVAGSLLALVLARPQTATPASSDAARTGTAKGAGLAVLTGLCIAAYSLVDGVGVRHSGTPLGYAAWLFAVQGVTIPSACYLLAPRKAPFLLQVRSHWRLGSLGGAVSLLAYSMVLWAQNQAPLALVSALRETSVLLAGVIGAIFFAERFSPLRMVLTIAAVGGIVALQLG